MVINMSKKRKRISRRLLYGDRYIEKAVRTAVIQRDDNKCCYCSKKNRKKSLLRKEVKLEFGHVIPHSMGGDTCIDNIQLECFECNRGKGAKIEPIGWFKLKLLRGAEGCKKHRKKKKRKKTTKKKRKK